MFRYYDLDRDIKSLLEEKVKRDSLNIIKKELELDDGISIIKDDKGDFLEYIDYEEGRYYREIFYRIEFNIDKFIQLFYIISIEYNKKDLNDYVVNISYLEDNKVYVRRDEDLEVVYIERHGVKEFIKKEKLNKLIKEDGEKIETDKYSKLKDKLINELYNMKDREPDRLKKLTQVLVVFVKNNNMTRVIFKKIDNEIYYFEYKYEDIKNRKHIKYLILPHAMVRLEFDVNDAEKVIKCSELYNVESMENREVMKDNIIREFNGEPIPDFVRYCFKITNLKQYNENIKLKK